ncbi:hypothetical protein DFH06DRAFT_1130305 [Mycena polygramma]|nr:hypothetical protein DFH06DRAFT_1130305 [Mycena polygramma]
MSDTATATTDPNICVNLETPGASCSDFFPYKESPGLCATCYITRKDPERAEKMKDWPQCTGCSAQLLLMKGMRCGTCIKKDLQIAAAAPPARDPPSTQGPNQTDPSTKQVQDLQAEARRNAMVARTLPKGASKAPGVSASLQAATAKGTPRQITVYLVPVTSGATRTDASRVLANTTRSFPEDIPMTDMLASLLRHWNLEWEKECSESLTPEHISLRLSGNVAIQPHSTLGTLGQFFETHDRIHGNNPKKILQGPSTLRLPSPAIYLEGLIAVTDFENETGALAPYFVLTEKENRKRKASQTGRDSVTSESNSLKHSKSQPPGPLRLRSDYGDVPGFSKITVALASVSVGQDGSVKIEWPNLKSVDAATHSSCLLQDTSFDQGKTKKVYKLIFDGLPWVAKHFFNIGAGEGQVEIQENHDQVVKEITRLSKATYFVQQFIAEAKRQDVDVDQSIHVTDFKLAIEVIQDEFGPSKASGFSLEQYKAACQVQGFEPESTASSNSDSPDSNSDTVAPTTDPGIVVWLFEPRLETVFCDLQTATAIDENGDAIQVLFDVMTHTVDCASGVGDHGKPGIETFLKKHKCVNRCSHLHLSRDGFKSDAVVDSDED